MFAMPGMVRVAARRACAKPVCRRGGRAAFTLIELLAVIAIIALLVSILVPSLQTAREMARKTVCMANLKSIGTGINLYISDNPDIVPPYMWAWHWNDGTGGEWTWDWPDLLVKYCDSTAKPTSGLGAQDYYSVGIQPSNGQYVRNQWGVSVVYSKRFNCASQKNRDKFHYTWNTTVLYWWYDYRYSSADAASWYRPHQLSEYKNPQRYCAVIEPAPTFATSAANFASEYITWRAGPDLAPRVPHLGVSNAAMLDGHVETFTPLSMLKYYDGSKTDVYSTQGYPFYPR